MALIAVSNPVTGVSVDGKQTTTVTLGAGAAADTLSAPVKLGFRKITRVWKDVTADFPQAAGGGVTLVGTTGAGTYRFEGL